MDPPSRGNHVDPASVFGWLEYVNTSGFPCFTEARYWIWCPTAHDMAGYLRHRYAVACLGELLDVTAWAKPSGYQGVEDLLAKAPPEMLEEARCDPKALVSAMQELDEAMKERSAARCFSKSRRAIHRFLGTVGDVEWLRNDLTLFNTPAAVGRHVVKTLESEDADVDEELGMSKAEWRRFCAGATRDRRSGKAFAKALEDLARV